MTTITKDEYPLLKADSYSEGQRVVLDGDCVGIPAGTAGTIGFIEMKSRWSYGGILVIWDNGVRRNMALSARLIPHGMSVYP